MAIDRYVVSLSLEEVVFGCEKTIEIKTSEICPACNGTGVGLDPESMACARCAGTGNLYHSNNITIQIPAGTPEGYQMNVKTRGTPGISQKAPGEIAVIISIKAHKLFKRSNDDIIYELPLNIAQSALGTEVNVPTLKTSVKLQIPSGTQTNAIFRLKGRGIQHLGKRGRGDQLVKIRVVTPTSLDDYQRHLLEQLGKSLPVFRKQRRKK
jgi:molecular chaperone DnaJ